MPNACRQLVDEVRHRRSGERRVAGGTEEEPDRAARGEVTRLLDLDRGPQAAGSVRAVLADVNAMLQQVATLEDVVAPRCASLPGW